MRVLLLVVGLLLVAVPSFAQPVTTGTPVQQTATDLQAAALLGTSATSAATITIPAGSGYIYITGIEITNCAGGTAVTAATPTSVTTTNLNGAAWTVGSGVTAGLCQPSPVNMPVGKPIKSSVPGTAVTFVLPTFATNQTVRVSVYGYYAQ